MKGWRTLTFNALSTLVPIISLSEWTSVFPKDWLPYWVLFVAVANMGLRLITDTPVGLKR